MSHYSNDNASLNKRIACIICIAALGSLIALGGATQSASADESWADDLDCSLCHAEEVEEIEETTHAVVDCTICHDDYEELAELHEEADDDTALPTKLKYTSVDDSICLECHGDGGIAAPGVETEDEDADTTDADIEDAEEDSAAEEKDDAAATTAKASDNAVAASSAKDDADTDKTVKADDTDTAEADDDDDADEEADADDEEETLPEKTQLIAATADSVVLTDSEGTVVNPHDLPDSTNHNKIVCVDCHKIHDTEADLAKTASKKCTSCHHENVYECYTCHA